LSWYPVVVLRDTFFPTGFGGRQRPHFKIERWVRFGDEGGQVEAASDLTPLPSATPSADKPTEQTTAQPDLPLETVKEPSLKEEMGDEVPFNDPVPDLGKAENPKPSPPRSTARREIKKPSAKTASRAPSRKRLTESRRRLNGAKVKRQSEKTRLPSRRMTSALPMIRS
jgi:hypothetical protein